MLLFSTLTLSGGFGIGQGLLHVIYLSWSVSSREATYFPTQQKCYQNLSKLQDTYNKTFRDIFYIMQSIANGANVNIQDTYLCK